MSVDPAWVALSTLPRVGSKTLQRLLHHFGSLDAIIAADVKTLQQVPGVGAKIAAAIQAVDVAAIAAEIVAWQRAGVQLITSDMPRYPAKLRQIDDEPPTLFVRGDNLAPKSLGRTVAIVGTRTPSDEGRQLAWHIGKTLAERGIAIVSGLAFGIDAEAHRGAVSLNYGMAIAVLGGGVLNIYPSQHHELASRILRYGVLLSENTPHATATAARLVARNRIISGLSEALIVVESPAHGGAMYAARAAHAQGRPIYTPPFAASGNQWLLANGANVLPDDLSVLLRDPQ